MLRDRILMSVTACILALAVAESLFLWKLAGGEPPGEVGSVNLRITQLEQALREKTAEADRLIRERHIERRAAGSHTAPAPITAEAELAQALLKTDSVHSTQGAPTQGSSLGPNDIDPKYLVNMANIMTGRQVAELKVHKGATVIHYLAAELASIDEDAPLWQLLDAVHSARALKGISLVGKNQKLAQSYPALKKEMVRFGLPSQRIEIRDSDPRFEGWDGVVIELIARRPS